VLPLCGKEPQVETMVNLRQGQVTRSKRQARETKPRAQGIKLLVGIISGLLTVVFVVVGYARRPPWLLPRGGHGNP
jgi:hypothetical protein